MPFSSVFDILFGYPEVLGVRPRQSKNCKQELRIKDLSQRYDVQAVLLDNWDEITELLEAVESNVKLKRVFISGSAQKFDAPWTQEKIEELAKVTAKKLVEKDYRITTGFGLGIGSAVINGALNVIYKDKFRHTDEYLCLRPFPQNIADPNERKRVFTQYRKDMLSEVGAAVFISGNKEDGGSYITAPGCIEEYKVAKDMGCIIIPIATTGYAAKEILEDIKTSITDYEYLIDEITVLETSTDVNDLSNAIVRILGKQCR